MYAFKVRVSLPFSKAVEETRNALRDAGFGIPMEIDVQKLFHDKLGVEDPPYLILGACNPALARQAIQEAPEIGVLLPCNIVVRRTGETETEVIFMDPVAILGLTGLPDLAPLADDVRARLERVRDHLGTAGGGA